MPQPPPPVRDELSDLDDEAPPGQPSPRAIRAFRDAPPPPPPVAPPEPARPRFWRMPRADTQRPQTLPQGVMFWRSTIAVSVLPAGPSGQFRASGFFGYAVGIFDDLEIGTNPLGVHFTSLSFQDPSFFLRARLVSGEVQFSLRGEWTIPMSSTGSAWMGYSAELAWNPIHWFRFETAIEYGLHFTQPLQQTIFVPVRAILQAGPNSFGLTTGVVMYNDADAFEVPLYLRYAVSFGGHQGPLSEPALEGGIAHLGNAGNAWFFRGVWTFYAYP